MRPNHDWLTQKSPKERLAFERAWLVNEFTEQICELMEREGVTAAELARRLGKSRAYVTQVLRGKDIILRTAATLAFALGYRISFSAERLERPEMSFTPDYVPIWGDVRAMQELLQNAADADDLGDEGGDAHPGG